MIHVLKRLAKGNFSSCLSIFSTIGTSPLTIRQSSSGGQSGWGITGFGKDSQGIDYMSNFCHILRENRQKKLAETTGNGYRIEILMSRKRKLKGLSAASLRLKTLNYNP